MTDLATLPDEQAADIGADRFTALVERLSRQSVDKHFDAYVDVPWDDPDFAIDPDDARWELPSDAGLGATSWYQEQPPEIRSRIGLHLTVANMRPACSSRASSSAACSSSPSSCRTGPPSSGTCTTRSSRRPSTR